MPVMIVFPQQSVAIDRARSWPSVKFGLQGTRRTPFIKCHLLVRYDPAEIVALNSLPFAIVVRCREVLPSTTVVRCREVLRSYWQVKYVACFLDGNRKTIGVKWQCNYPVQRDMSPFLSSGWLIRLAQWNMWLGSNYLARQVS